MSKRFYPIQDFVKVKRPRKPSRWPWYALASLLLVAVFWVVNDLDWQVEPYTPTQPVRKQIASTATSSELASLEPEDTVRYDLSIAVDSAIVKQGDTSRVLVEQIDSTNTLAAAEEKVPESSSKSEKIVAAVKLPTVTLFNGCGVKGIGKRAKAALERMGFEVIEVRNARSFEYMNSEVLDRSENRKHGTLLADSLGIPSELAAWDTTRSDKQSDVSLIVGADFKKLKWKL